MLPTRPSAACRCPAGSHGTHRRPHPPRRSALREHARPRARVRALRSAAAEVRAHLWASSRRAGTQALGHALGPRARPRVDVPPVDVRCAWAARGGALTDGAPIHLAAALGGRREEAVVQHRAEGHRRLHLVAD
eukprot:3233282-Prymnesium_polylepis.1